MVPAKAIHPGKTGTIKDSTCMPDVCRGLIIGEYWHPAKVAETLKSKPGMVHIILTGRNARPTIVELADTVTEMRCAKRAYEKGVMARRGIGY
jgi:ATP:corrinoid adenosyltransferase